jgi:hypothetical protein
VPARPWRHQARGSRRWYVDEASSSPSLDLTTDKAQQLERKARDRHGRSLKLQRRRGCKCPGGNRVDLADRRNRCRLIYRLSTILAAETGGARRNRALRQRGDAVTKGVARREETRVSEGKRRPVGLTEPLVGLDQ